MYFPIITEEEELLPMYITGMGHQQPQENIDRPKGFSDYQWIYCANGEGEITIDYQKFIVTSGQSFYIAPHIPHQYKATGKHWETYWIMYKGTSLDLIYHQLNLGPFGVFQLGTPLKLYKLIYHLLESDQAHKTIDSSALLYSLIIEQKNSLQSTLTSKTVSPLDKLQPVIQYMRYHLDEDLSLDLLAKIIDVTTYYLCKLFKSAFSLTPITYLTRLRIQRSKELLLTQPTYPIHHISGLVGYRDTSYFCHMFKKNEGVSPTEFRKTHGL